MTLVDVADAVLWAGAIVALFIVVSIFLAPDA